MQNIAAARERLATGDPESAEKFLRRVIDQDSEHVEALRNLAALAERNGNSIAALAMLNKALVRGARLPALHTDMGNILLRQNQFADAARAYTEAIEIDPAYTVAHNNLALALKSLDRDDEALASLRRTMQIDPGYAEAHGNLANLLQEKGDLGEAISHCREAIRLQPRYAAAHNTLGVALRLQGDIADATASFRAAIEILPGYYEAHINLGNALAMLGDEAAAIAIYRAAIQLVPDAGDAHYNLSLVLLAQGNLDEGWSEYAWRDRTKYRAAITRPTAKFPAWEGADPSAMTILVLREQGIGDDIMFASVLPDLLATAKHCVIECAMKLAPLFARSFPRATVHGIDQSRIDWALQQIDWADALNIDCRTSMGSLPQYFRKRVENFPIHDGYLVPDAERVAEFRASLEKLGPGLKVGIGWHSRVVAGSNNQLYATTLEQWAPLFAIPGITWVNLQYDRTEEERQRLQKDTGVKVHDLGIDLTDDLDASAALTKACDLVISVETAVSMMAGAVGVPVWQLSLEHSWHTLGTDRTPWFPGMTRFERGANETWDSVLAKIAPRLATLAQRESGSR